MWSYRTVEEAKAISIAKIKKAIANKKDDALMNKFSQFLNSGVGLDRQDRAALLTAMDLINRVRFDK